MFKTKDAPIYRIEQIVIIGLYIEKLKWEFELSCLEDLKNVEDNKYSSPSSYARFVSYTRCAAINLAEKKRSNKKLWFK